MMGKQHGGIGRYVLEMVKNLLEIDKTNNYSIFVNDHDFSGVGMGLFARQSLGDGGKPIPTKAKFISANIRHYSAGEQLRFHRILDKYNLDLVHFPNFNFPLMYKKPFVVTIHDMVHHRLGGAKKSHLFHFLAYKKVISEAAKRSARIITVSQASKRDIAQILQVSPEKISVTYEGAGMATDVAPSVTADVKRKFLIFRPYFLFVGVLERKKNVVNLTRGFDQFIQKYKLDMDLVIVGPADKHYPDVKHHALDIKASDRLVFTDKIDDEELAGFYKGAHAFVSASMHEGFGLPGLEAMKFGLPLAVSNIEVFNEIYDNAAVYFNPLDPEDIAEKLKLLATDTQFYQQQQIKSMRRSEMFSWKKCAEETLSIYQEIGNTVEINRNK